MRKFVTFIIYPSSIYLSYLLVVAFLANIFSYSLAAELLTMVSEADGAALGSPLCTPAFAVP